MMGACKAPGALQQANQHYQRITNGDEILDIYGYINNPIKKIITYLLTIFTFGLIQVVFHWFPLFKLKCTSNECCLKDANLILIKDDHKNVKIKHIKLTIMENYVEISGGESLKLKNMRIFHYRKVSYLWHPTKNIFTSIESLEGSIPISYFHSITSKNTGYSLSEVSSKLLLYGKNLIEVKLNPIPLLLVREVITPFYMFQIFSVTIWYCDNYAYYASIIIVMSLLSIISDVIQIRKQEKKLRAMVHSDSYVKVLRNGGKIEEINSAFLVPGDILLVPPHGCNLQCDAVLMNGTVIVNEAMLTGESVPVTKVPLPEDDDNVKETIFSLKEHSRHVLFCGTTVLQSRNHGGKPATAIVLRTAYSTLKGELVRSIMYPKPVDFSFTKDLFKFIFFLAGIACCGFGYTIVIMYLRGATIKKIIIRTLDIVTIVVPPALPAAMSIGILNAQMRLKLKEIFCISPSTINTCGAINIVCFDKTGTLTEDGLDFHCYKSVVKDEEDKPCFGAESHEFDVAEDNNHLRKAIATCHSLTKIEEELCGDPLDIILFNKSGFALEESGEDDDVEETARFDLLQPTLVTSKLSYSKEPMQLAIIRQFTFSSSLQRMTVLVHNLEEGRKQLTLYCKGAPEMIASLCDPSSIPSDYTEVVNNYALHGYRLIAVAYRSLEMSYSKAQKVSRDEIECNLKMLGLVAMENRIKDQTLGVINQLNNAKIRTVMVTGDNLLTALSVARDCAIVRPNKLCYIIDIAPGDEKINDGRTKLICKEAVSSSEENIEEDNLSTSMTPSIEAGTLVNSAYHLAISGPTFRVICEEYPELIDKLVCVCDVYARMSPDQKQHLVNRLQEVHYTVAMCGDGANDCAALKAAHAGISLSAAEASIAAPFTSKVPDIRCVPHIIREGRAALVTSFGIFKYMAGYSLTQFITIMHLYWLGTNLTDFEFLYIDLLLITLVAITFGATPACERLHKTPPPTRLLSLASVLSILGQLTIIGFCQMFTFIFVSLQPWFIPYTAPITAAIEDKRSMQGTAIFCVSTFQYITLAIIYSKGKPYRKSIFSNRWLMISLITMTLISIYITLYPAKIVIYYMEFDPIPYFSDRLLFFFIGIISATCSYIFEVYVVDYLILTVREKHIKHKKIINDENPRSYETILSQISNDISWIRYIFPSKSASNPQSAYFTPAKSYISTKSSSSSSETNSKFCTPTKSVNGLLLESRQVTSDEENNISRTMTTDSALTIYNGDEVLFNHGEGSSLV